ncbi:MAG: hypothetical protein OYH77_07185 [Pseudomonadota bacterium]|nr:hypothetical protein [Pseudomonadota bacterium]
MGILRLANDFISLSGVKTNNLKNISVAIPKHKFTCITGASGAGKTSLVFGTLHQEAHRRFLATLSRQESQHIQPQSHAQLDHAANLPASIAVKQQHGKPDLRATLGTLTHINEYLRLLFCQTASRHCYKCLAPLHAYDYGQATKAIIQRYDKKSICIAAPLRFTAIDYSMLTAQGFDRFVNIKQPQQPLTKDAMHPQQEYAVLISQVRADAHYTNRIQDAVRTSYQIAKGRVLVGVDGQAKLLSRNHECFTCELTSIAPTPAYFSYYHPLGACLSCNGIGCATCDYERLQPKHRAYQIQQQTFPALLRMTAVELQLWLVSAKINNDDLVAELRRRLDFVCRLKLDYIAGERPAASLSWGEVQRAKIAACLGTELVDMLYCFDEPTTGLHSRDSAQLHDLLKSLCARQNTVVAVEHDQYFIRNADYLIVLGTLAKDSHTADTGGGNAHAGGEIIYAGVPSGYQPVVPVFNHQSRGNADKFIHASGITTHNLQSIAVRIPLRRLTCVCGVSGSGKSSLMHHTIFPLLKGHKQCSKPAVACKEFVCDDKISDVVLLGQNMTHVSNRANSATFIGIYAQIRRMFAKTSQAQRRGFTQACFSFNTQQGQCPACKGLGFFMRDYATFGSVHEQCHLCMGKQFRREVLKIQLQGMNIKEVLDLNLLAALEIFKHQHGIRAILAKGVEVGLGYLTLGQPLSTLSNGEFQRLRLLKMLTHEHEDRDNAGHCSKKNGAGMVLIFDEPSVGLADSDVALFLHQINKMPDEHTVIIIDHHVEILKSADWLIKLGEHAGADGGRVLYCGEYREEMID